MDISKHKLLKDCYDVMQAIEECGASPQLTDAVTKAGELMKEIEKLVDQISEAKAALEISEKPFFEGMSVLNNITA